ncbi:MAG TPA: AAA family ATPase [Anaerolineales bacterium]|nr:AAA family ATPase [Anaerolineales bacterium]
MLTRKMQIQALADRLAGYPVHYSARSFQEPWRTCWLALEGLSSKGYREALMKALENNPDQSKILEALFATRPGHKMHFESLEEIAPNLAPLEWLWPGWLPRGMLTLFGAAPGAGKSFAALDLSWRITTNQGFPDGSPIPNPEVNIVYVDGEAVPQILNDRALAYGIDRKKLFLLLPDPGEAIDFGQEKYRDRLLDMVATLKPELVIIDSLSSIHSKGQNNIEDVRELLGFLAQLAEAHRTGMLLIHHIRKPGNGQNMQMFDLTMSDLSGSSYIVAMARVVWGLHVIQTGAAPNPNGPRLLKVLKTNLGPYERPLSFTFAPLPTQGVTLQWAKDAPGTFQELTKREECEQWLLALLAEGPMKPAEVVELGEQEGFARNLIYRARRKLSEQIENTEGKNSPVNQWILAGPRP